MDAIRSYYVDTFFDNWYYKEGFPEYTINVTHQDNSDITFTINQTTSHESVDFFALNLPILFKGASGESKLGHFHNTTDGEEFTFNAGFEVSDRITSYNVCYTKLLRSWDYCRYALEFLSSKPLDKMTPNDNLASGNNNWCLADEGREYIVFLSEGGTSSLNITKDGTYDVRWYDPRNGGSLQSGSVTTISGTGNKALGNAPNNGNQDWVVYIKNNDGNSYPVRITSYNVCYTKLLRIPFALKE